MMTIKVKGLGLAAYIVEGGSRMVDCDDDNVFTLESDRTEREWSLEYENSCCSSHDARVMALRKFMKKRHN